MNNNFKYHSNFNETTSFQSVKFGYDRPILETELNELQQLQDNARQSLARRLTPSGFIELVQKEFTGDSILYNPVSNMVTKLNHIALAPSRVLINGMEANLSGNFSYNGYDNYVLVDLGEAPTSGTRTDLVYLEVWQEVLTADDSILKYGYANGNVVSNTMIDPRVNNETSRRIALKWNIKVAKNVNFKSFYNGFGYTDITRYSPIYAAANGQLGFEHNTNLLYRNASDDIFKNCSFYKDYNLWVAGREDYSLNSTSIFGQYIFAIPLFKVTRRNKTDYSIENFNGSKTSITPNITSSLTKGDLANYIRPDQLCYDYIVEQDLVDLRRTITTKEFNSDYYLNKSLKQLFTGNLQTKDTKKMRRIQFGRKQVDYNSDSNVIFVSKFNKDVEPMKLTNVVKTTYSTEGNVFEYRDSVGGYGLFCNGKNLIKYGASGVNVDYGTIDFFIQPYWNSYDPSVSQTILTLLDVNDNPIFLLEKRKTELIWTQYTGVIGSTDATVNQIVVDLTNNLLFAKQIYSLRLSWTNNSKINKSYIYLNGNMIGDSSYTGSKLNPARLKVGNIETVKEDLGFVMEELVIYNTAFELTKNNGTYTYITNEFWPNLPADFMNGSAMLYPSFNSYFMNFEDNTIVQKDTLSKLKVDTPDSGKFILEPPYGKKINKINYTYNVLGDYDSDYVIDYVKGTWTEVDNTFIFIADDTTINEILVQYDLEIPGGNGGIDLPNEMLMAGIANDTYFDEISFNRKNSEKRTVPYANPNRVSAATDTAFDFSTNREKNQCYTRLLYLHKSGDGTNQYEIPTHLYGYEVIGIVNALNRKITRIQRTPDTVTENGTSYGKYVITLLNNVTYGDVLQLQVALGGLTFDYETQTKSIVSNMHKVIMAEVVCDGLKNEFVVPCFDYVNGGIIKSVYSLTDNLFEDANYPKKVTGSVNKYACYVDGEMYPQLPARDNDGNLTGKFTYQLAEMTVDESCFGTPFLKFSLKFTPADKVKIVIPILVSYQPKETDVISVWYNYIPYQGILSNTTKKLKRISDWKYFMTTLSSGNLSLNIKEENVNSLNNIINRLPGGNSFAYTVNGDNIIFNNLKESVNKTDLNLQLTFPKDIMFASENNNLDDYFFELDTDLNISRLTKGFQDEKLIMDKKFRVYFQDIYEEISKYTGMACLVIDESGELLLFVIGNLNNGEIDGTKSKENVLTPLYGDLYKIPGLPVSIQQF